MATLTVANEVEKKNHHDNSQVVAITLYSSKRNKQKEVEDLFGYGGILKGRIDIPKGKKELRKAYHERNFA